MHKRNVLALLLLALLGSALRADEVTLKDGTKIYGTIVKETNTTIIILTMKGRMRIRQSKVELVIENTAFGDKILDARVSQIDADDPDALAEVAAWAKKRGHRGWKMVARKVLNMAADNDLAHELMGHTKVGDTWYQSKKEAAKARKKLMAEEMKAKGFVYVKRHRQEGWVKKEDKKLVLHNTEDWMVDDDQIWKPKSEVMAKRGYIHFGNKWIKASPEDLGDMKKYKELSGEDLLAITSPHFRLFVSGFTAEKAEVFSKLCEDIYAWFLKTVAEPPDHALFRGNKGNLWILKDKNAVIEWFGFYRNRYSLGEGAKKLIETGSGNFLSPQQLVGTAVNRQNVDVRFNLAHTVGVFCLFWFSPGLKGPPAWLAEAWGHLAEESQLGEGHICMSTLSRYSASGDKATKEFTTKDAKERAKGIIRNASDEPFANLQKIGLNQLNGDHYAEGFAIITWLLETHKKEFIAWLNMRNTAKDMDALRRAFKGWTGTDLDKAWRAYALKHY